MQPITFEVVTDAGQWTLRGLQELDAFLDSEPDDYIRIKVLQFAMGLLDDPYPADQALHRAAPLPIFAMFVPDTDVLVVYLVVEHSRSVLLKRVRQAPPGNGVS